MGMWAGGEKYVHLQFATREAGKEPCSKKKKNMPQRDAIDGWVLQAPFQTALSGSTTPKANLSYA